MQEMRSVERRKDKSGLWSSSGWYMRRKAAGLCKSCPQPVMPHSASVCLKHWFSDIADKRLGSSRFAAAIEAKMNAQNFRCAYTGMLLVPGVNASLDHTKPVSKYPHLQTDPSNVQWVLHDVNMAKRGLSHQEFISMCSAVADWAMAEGNLDGI